MVWLIKMISSCLDDMCDGFFEQLKSCFLLKNLEELKMYTRSESAGSSCPTTYFL